jgi:small-conductance mechanosensitive channel
LAIKVLAAVAGWTIGRWLIGRTILLAPAPMSRKPVDPRLIPFRCSTIATLLNIALVLGSLAYFGSPATSLAVMLAVVGVAIGAAWSGLLGNVAAGALMRVLRPIKVGDVVSVAAVVAARMPKRAKARQTKVNGLDAKLEGRQISGQPYRHTKRDGKAYFDAHAVILQRCKGAGWPAPLALHRLKQVQA